MSLRVVGEAAKTSAVLSLYRSICKEVPRVLTIYDIEIPASDARAAIRDHFRKNKDVKDPRIVAGLVAKGQMELEEALMQWKSRNHIIPIFAREKPKRQKSVLEKFFENGEE